MYYMYGEQKEPVSLAEFKRNVKVMPEKDSNQIIGISQNLGLVYQFNQTKKVLTGLATYYSDLKLVLKQEEGMNTLFDIDKDPQTIENRQLLLSGFQRDFSVHKETKNKMK
mmetsp:Transcript_9206/g.8601  ORF Transcript_9206/g.8601 Transcript_9206/m.8601 type:complete len:111 (+) Transcript_9206:1708-2040(+)